jgi:hypothetical protein
MKYMALIYANGSGWDELSQDQQKAVMGEYQALAEDPHTVGSEQLQPAETATTVRVQDGQALTTDGPFVETKEQLGGYYVFEADDLDGAIALAARIPASRSGGAVEVRPILEM